MSENLQQNPNPRQEHENCPHQRTDQPVFSSLPQQAEESGAMNSTASTAAAPEASQSAVHAEASPSPTDNVEAAAVLAAVSEKTDDIDAILAEVDAKRQQPAARENADVPVTDHTPQETDPEQAASDAPSAEIPKAETVTPPKKKSAKKKKRKKKKRKRNSFAQGMRDLFPRRGDSAFDVVRKIIFLVALIVFAVCL